MITPLNFFVFHAVLPTQQDALTLMKFLEEITISYPSMTLKSASKWYLFKKLLYLSLLIKLCLSSTI